jgi:hypothetical protein
MKYIAKIADFIEQTEFFIENPQINLFYLNYFSLSQFNSETNSGSISRVNLKAVF